jgi:site-specific recombinase XerD
MSEHELEPLTPSTAKQMYLDEREGQVADRTLQAHDYRLRPFVQWCQEVQGLENLNELTGRLLHKYRLWRKDDGDLKAVSLRSQLETLRVFLKFCESIDGVSPGLHDQLLLPSLDDEDEQREEILEPDQADAALTYLRQFKYASRRHVILELLWHTGMRLGTLRALDVDDYGPEPGRLAVQHRPGEGTALKNGTKAERLVALDPGICEVLDAWIDHQRPEVTDKEGRDPLLTTENGRIAGTTIRETVYSVTRPCFYAGECPHDRDPEECEATKYGYRSQCPSSVSPHSVRRGSITHHLSEDVPEKVVSDRMDVGQEVLDKHYDKRSEEQKVEQRREYLRDM